MQKKRILTGDRPTGKLHLGHYVGTLKNRVKLQDTYETFIIIADYHALTTKPSKEDISKFNKNIEDMVFDYLSVGMDPGKIVFYRQSSIPEVAELFLIFSMLVTVPRAQRIPTLKEIMKDLEINQPSMGLLAYPILQAADILMVKGDLVPVGKDQESHVELAREIARTFNKTYEKVFPETKALVGETPTLPGTDGKLKMSKSLNNAIYLSDSKEEVERKVKGMYTDPTRVHATDPGKVEGNPVFIYLDEFGGEENEEKIKDLKKRYKEGTVGDVEVKSCLTEVLNGFLEPIRERRKEFQKNPEIVEEILRNGKKKVRLEAQKTLSEVKEAMGLT
ncbi:tryptophan--tRNA ligase [Patescibacteria group bacterium]|nr:tryptophan--tRNA ligase [Patescibacteria group bacterium]MBU0777420.1 tryptophan--tRNA ligase [Patescibacteria group bacterium]MBU0846056.1 tryptophan--tRNA ligase [Patescibacteria group bacterium]MBU0922444.1 tryptophan--tRNA ligase [Patescibacteria group bacterium]MBU1066823.1 tryptophan--tRNA ligase [Patescibacteria group bacterium]